VLRAGQYGRVPDLRWEEVAQWLELDGLLLDAVVADTTADDWQAVFDLIRSVGWWHEYRCGGRPVRLPRAVDILASRGQVPIGVSVRPVPGILVNFHLFSADEIEFDFDPRELHGQAPVDVLCHVVRRVGRKLGKRVIVAPEGRHDRPVAVYDPGIGRVSACSPSSHGQACGDADG
jgi:hypothetical protein